MTVKVRIAPSPTGNLHIGTAQSALFNWLFARANGGQFIVRIEDTDLERSSKEYEQSITEGLAWLGLAGDNPAPIRQSERLPLYRKHLEQLLKAGAAYEKTFTEEEKDALRKEGREPRDSIIVLKAPDPGREIVFEDVIRGRVAVLGKHVGSVALAKDLDTPLYNFSNVVDDIDMAITHVIRGEDHISNTPKQLLIYEALGAIPPRFAHLPLILASDRSKMSKRHGATSVVEYQKDYLPETLVNFLGSMSYTFDRELLSRDEMIAQFDLAKVHKSGAVFDQDKLDWMNAQHLKRLPPEEFKALIGHPDLPDAAVPIMTERLERLSSIDQFAYLWADPVYEADLLLWKDQTPQDARRALEAVLGGSITQERLDQIVGEQFSGKKGSVYWPLRTALSGARNSAGPIEIAAAIGQAQTEKRIEAAIEKLT